MRFPSSRHTGRLSTLVLLSGLALSFLAKAELCIQIGAYRSPENAARMASTLAAAGVTNTRVLPAKDGETLTKVSVGPFTSAEEASAAQIQLAARGWNGLIINSRAVEVLSAPAEPSPTPSIPSAERLASVTPDGAQPHKSRPNPRPDQTFDGWQGFYQSEFAYTTPQPAHWSKLRQLFEFGGSGAFTHALRWKLNARLAYDPLYEHSSYYPSAVRDDQLSQATLREAYLDYSTGDWDFRFGRQHIIWGEMVGLFFADVVSAKDLHQFIAQDFDLLRIPQWALRGEYFQGDSHAELVWIPVMSYDEIGKPGADFYPFKLAPPPGFDMVIESEQHPANSLSNSAYGARFSHLADGWDLSAFYYRSVDASPAFFREVVTTPEPLVRFQPDHDKIHQFGLTLAKELGPAVLKAEAVYTRDRWFTVTNTADTDGVVRQDLLDYIVGLEHVSERGAHLNVQFFQRWFPDHAADMIPDELESGVSFYTSTKLANGRLEPELLWIESLNRKDGMVRPRLTWHADGHWRFAVGFDLFHGPDTGLFGQFDRSDRVVGEARYTF